MHRLAIKYFLFFLILFLSWMNTYAQEKGKNINNKSDTTWSLTLNVGTQMSGIKDEDFIKSNYSPLINFEIGKCITRSLSLQIGYRGWYFNTISDNYKHFYGYYYGETVFNLNELISKYDYNKKWNVFFHIGSGFFYNYDYKRPNICANLSISSNYRLSKRIATNINFSSIMGWDIYQGDEDILPSLSIGITYFLY